MKRAAGTRGVHDSSVRSRGATLIEVLVGCGVFVFLMLSSIAIMNMGTGGFRAVEAKADITRNLNRFEADLTTELKRASQASVGIYTPSTDYHWAIWMKTPMNSLDSVDENGNPGASLGDPLVPITRDGRPVMQRYLLYYITRMDQALHDQLHGYHCASYTSNPVPDTTCPHKWIVKKELYLRDASDNDVIGAQTDSGATGKVAALVADAQVTDAGLSSQNGTPPVHRVSIVARNILSFEVTRLGLAAGDPLAAPTVSPTGPIILFDVKAFKSLTAERSVEVGRTAAATVTTADVNGTNMVSVQPAAAVGEQTVSVHTSSSVVPQFGSFTVQLDNRVIPQNP